MRKKDGIWKHIRWFFIRELALPSRYSDIPDWDEKLENELLILRAERIAESRNREINPTTKAEGAEHG